MEDRLKATAMECEKLQSLSNELRSEKKGVEKKNQQVLNNTYYKKITISIYGKMLLLIPIQLLSRIQTLESELKEEKEVSICNIYQVMSVLLLDSAQQVYV